MSTGPTGGNVIAELIATIRADTSDVDSKLDRLRKELERTEDKIEALHDAFRAGKIGLDAFDNELDQLVTDAQTLRGAMASLPAALQATADAADKAAKSQRAARGMSLELSRAFEDFIVTGGSVSASINNFNRLFEIYAGKAGISAGATAGISMGITALGIGLNALVNHWKEITEEMGFGSKEADHFRGRLETLDDTIKGLEKKEIKLYIDDLAIKSARDEVERLRRDYDELQKAMGRQTLEERASGAEVERVTTGAEARAALTGAKARRRRELEDQSVDLKLAVQKRGQTRQDIASIEEQLKNPKIEQIERTSLEQLLKSRKADLEKQAMNEAAIRSGIATQAHTEVGGVLHGAIHGVGGAQAENQRRLREILRGQGAAGAAVAGRLEGATPEGVRQKKLEEARIKAENEQEAESIKEGAQAAVKATREAAAAKEKAARDAAAAAKRVESEHDKAINAQASKFGGAFKGQLQDAMAKHRRFNIPAGKSDAALERQLVGRLPADIPGEDRAEVARAIIAKSRLEFSAGQAAAGVAPAVAAPPRRRMTTAERRRAEMDAYHRAHRRAAPGVSTGPGLPSVAPALPALPPITIPKLDVGGAGGGVGGDKSASIDASLKELVAQGRAKGNGPVKPIALIGNTA